MVRTSWLLALAVGMLGATESEGQTLRVLFLGDKGHHAPADRAAQIVPVLAGRSITVTYTEDTAALEPTNLARYDAILVYANIERIEPARTKALIEYVEAGGGYVPIHCASYCFLDSPGATALLGAQFLRHGTGEFDTKVIAPGHPIARGLEPFRTWDETYLHHKHNLENREVIQVRDEGGRAEPWTWTRTQGKGRVFYTAYGHDARTWEHPGFHDLVERGIRWASGKSEVRDGRPRVKAGLQPFAYDTPADKIPNYIGGRKWGTEGEAISRMQRPVSPAESIEHMALPAGFEAKLFVAEPDIARPIAMAWDHRGRLWVAETQDYPNEKRPPGQGRDQIKICEDTDGDGRADKFSVFAEKLSIPTSLAFARGGLLVTQAPQILFLKDNDGDDRADSVATLNEGWGVKDTHAGPSNLRYGFDNRIWGMVGYSGFKGRSGGEPLEFQRGFFRFRPDGSDVEFLRGTDNNSWGVGFSEEGLSFGSTANNCASVFFPIPNRVYESVRGWSPEVLKPITATNRYFPATEKVRQMDWHGGYTAAAGHALYTARAYPEHYWNKTAFVTEPTGHLVNTFLLHPKGTDFAATSGWNLLGSDDEWTSPIAAEVGPDGQVWVIDWYNYIVQHNPTPQGFKTGKGNAYETPLRDKTHGRIYRVVYRDAKPSATVALDPADRDQLIQTLASDNQFWRLTAQRLLVDRGGRDAVPGLVKLVADASVDAIGLNPGAIHALWSLHGLGALDGRDPVATEAAVGALRHRSAGVRRNAALVLPRDEPSRQALLDARSLADPDPQARLAAFLALAEMPATGPQGASAGGAVAQALVDGRADGDRWLADAATATAAKHDRAFLAALARMGKTPGGPTLAVAARVAEHLVRGEATDFVNPLVVSLAAANPKIAAAIIGGIGKGWSDGKVVALDPAAEAALGRIFERAAPGDRGPLVGLAGRWGSKALEPQVGALVDDLLGEIRDDSKPVKARIEAARRLIAFRRSDDAAAMALVELATPRVAPELAVGLIEAAALGDAPGFGSALVVRLAAIAPEARPAAIRALLGRSGWTPSLLDGLERGDIRAADLSLDQAQALASHPDGSIASRAKAILAAGTGLPNPDRQRVIDSLLPGVLKGGDAERGRLVYIQNCAKCHMHDGQGGKIGPDLSGMAAHPAEELLVHILDPSRSVEGNFAQYQVATTEGLVITGLLASSTQTALELVDAEGKRQTVLRSDIEELVESKKSLMPEGFETQVPPVGLADLLAFLGRRGKYLTLDLRKVATAVSTKPLFTGPDADIEKLIFPDWSGATFEGVPFRLVDPEGDRTPNVVLLRGPRGAFPPRMPLAVSLPCHAPAKAIHILGGISGWGHAGGVPSETVSMIVRLLYEDGTVEDHPLKDGVHMADFIRRVDVPGSKLAFQLRGRQVRYLAITPAKATPIGQIELRKGNDVTAPVVMAVTVEVAN